MGVASSLEAAGPAELHTGSRVGFRCLTVARGSPAHAAGLVSFFDFIVAANGTRLDVESDALARIVGGVPAGGRLSLDVYNSKARFMRQVELSLPPLPSPSPSSPSSSSLGGGGGRRGSGAGGRLGLFVRLDTYVGAWENVLAVAEVEAGSPAAAVGLRPGEDWLLGHRDGVFDCTNALGVFVRRSVGRGNVKLFVYHRPTDTVRQVRLDMTAASNGLGAVVAHGKLHELPNTATAGSTAFADDPPFGKGGAHVPPPVVAVKVTVLSHVRREAYAGEDDAEPLALKADSSSTGAVHASTLPSGVVVGPLHVMSATKKPGEVAPKQLGGIGSPASPTLPVVPEAEGSASVVAASTAASAAPTAASPTAPAASPKGSAAAGAVVSTPDRPPPPGAAGTQGAVVPTGGFAAPPAHTAASVTSIPPSLASRPAVAPAVVPAMGAPEWNPAAPAGASGPPLHGGPVLHATVPAVAAFGGAPAPAPVSGVYAYPAAAEAVFGAPPAAAAAPAAGSFFNSPPPNQTAGPGGVMLMGSLGSGPTAVAHPAPSH